MLDNTKLNQNEAPSNSYICNDLQLQVKHNIPLVYTSFPTDDLQNTGA